MYKSEKELKELKEKYTQLETAYNELKNSIEVKDSEQACKSNETMV